MNLSSSRVPSNDAPHREPPPPRTTSARGRFLTTEAAVSIHGRKPSTHPELLADRYEVLELLGRGAMGDVFRARHVHAGRIVALKIVNSSFANDDGVRERLRAEARACSAARHPNIVEVYDAGQLDDGRPYVAMEYLDGRQLLALFESGPLPVVRACGLVLAVTRAIAAAHRVGIIHRDLKPENVMLATRDGVEVLKVLDFGISAAVQPEGGRATLPGVGVGTPEYMAPEQIYGVDPTPRFDIYALGVLLFEALSGTLPFVGDTAAAVLHRKATTPAPSLATRRADLPEPLVSLVDACLALEPEARPSSADDVARVLEVYAEQPRVMTVAQPQPEPQPRRRGAIVVACAAALAAAVVASFALREPVVVAGASSSLAPLAHVRWNDRDETTVVPAAVVPTIETPAIEAPAVIPAPVVEAPAVPTPAPRSMGVAHPRRPAARSLPSVAPRERTPGATPDDDLVPSSETCIRMRAQADDYRNAHDWDGVLRSTARSDCWKSTRDRVRMRVKAFLELHRFSECARTAGTIDDNEIRRDAMICTARMTGPK